MTIIEKALTRLETIEREKRSKKPPVVKTGRKLALEAVPALTQPPPPRTDFIINRVKRKRNRQKWIVPVASLVVAILVVLFSWKANLFNIKYLVKNSEMYSFVMMIIENTEPQTLPKIAGRKADDIPIGIPEDSVSSITPMEKPKIIAYKPESAREEAKAIPIPKAVLKEYSWIKKGWSALDRKKQKAALLAWEAGLRSLPGRHLVLIAGVYEDKDDALKKLRRIGKGSSTFLVKGKGSTSEKEVYYLLSAPHPVDLQSVRKEMASVLNRSSIRGNYANKLLARMRAGAKVAGTSTSAGKKKQTVVAKTIDKKSKPARKAATVKNVKPAKTKRVEKHTLNYGKRLGFVKELLNDSLYSEAVDNLKPLFDTPPAVWEPYLLMGTAYLGLGDLNMADSYFKKGLVVDGNRPRLWLQRAVVAQQKDDHDAALKILHKVEKLAPRMPEIKLNIGYSNDVLGKKSKAAKSYQSFLALTEGRKEYFSLRLQVVQRLIELGYRSTE